MFLWWEHNHTISESCPIPSVLHLMKASPSWTSQLFLYNSSSFRLHNLLPQPLGRRKHRMKNYKHYRQHVWDLVLEALGHGWGFGIGTVLLLVIPPLQILCLIVQGCSLNWWMRFWWQTWRVHLDRAMTFCLFYSGFCRHNRSRHEILQWFAESNSGRIHFCAPDTALYAGTGRWITNLFSHCLAPCFRLKKNDLKITYIIPDCIFL